MSDAIGKPHIRIEGGRPHVYVSRRGAFDCYDSFAGLCRAWPTIIKRIEKRKLNALISLYAEMIMR